MGPGEGQIRTDAEMQILRISHVHSGTCYKAFPRFLVGFKDNF